MSDKIVIRNQYSCRISNVKKSNGHSPLRAIAYIQAKKMANSLSGVEHNFSNKSGVIDTGFFMPNGIDTMMNEEQIYNHLENNSHASTNILAYTSIMSLPSELDADNQKKVVQDFCKYFSDTYQTAVSYAIHEADNLKRKKAKLDEIEKHLKVGPAYYDIEEGKDNIAQFEFIPWILGTCANLEEAKTTLIHMNLTNTPYSEQFPLAQLHWIIADQSGAITVEAMEDGMHIYENNVGVLTNNPPFNIQMFLLNQYMNLSPKQPENLFAKDIDLDQYSRGMGAIGLPGDLSSSSRFAKVAFTKLHSVSGDSENESVNQFFHILGSVDQQRGCCDVNGKYEITLYTSCCNTQKGIYYYTTYDNHQISAVDMTKEDLNTKNLICYEVITGEHIQMQN